MLLYYYLYFFLIQILHFRYSNMTWKTYLMIKAKLYFPDLFVYSVKQIIKIANWMHSIRSLV
jgi:hypothetical protein